MITKKRECWVWLKATVKNWADSKAAQIVHSGRHFWREMGKYYFHLKSGGFSYEKRREKKLVPYGNASQMVILNTGFRCHLY